MWCVHCFLVDLEDADFYTGMKSILKPFAYLNIKCFKGIFYFHKSELSGIHVEFLIIIIHLITLYNRIPRFFIEFKLNFVMYIHYSK